MNEVKSGSKGKLVWAGRPSVSVFYSFYGIVSLVLGICLVIVEFWLGANTDFGAIIFPNTFSLGGITIAYPVEIVTVVLVIVGYLAEIANLGLLRARHEYELYEDGLYIDSGIVNLQNTFLSPMAFSDARLIRNWQMRVVERGLIIVDANDGRKFQLLMIEKPLEVQELIRRTLAHPVVRIEHQ